MIRPGRRTLLGLLTVFVLSMVPALLARPALAQDADEAEARRRFKKGSRLFEEERYTEAAREFEAGYAILPRPGFLLNIAHSYRRAGDLRQAKRYYEHFLREDTQSIQRDEVLGYIRQIDEHLAEEGGAANPEGRAPPLATPAPAPPIDLSRACSPAEDKPFLGGWLPWTVGAAALAAGLAAGFFLLRDPARADCGTLGCFSER